MPATLVKEASQPSLESCVRCVCVSCGTCLRWPWFSLIASLFYSHLFHPVYFECCRLTQTFRLLLYAQPKLRNVLKWAHVCWVYRRVWFAQGWNLKLIFFRSKMNIRAILIYNGKNADEIAIVSTSNPGCACVHEVSAFGMYYCTLLVSRNFQVTLYMTSVSHAHICHPISSYSAAEVKRAK